jgi:hypothetical protein
MKYLVVSPRVGVPGTEYDVEAATERGINIAGLIAGGFIRKVSTPKPTTAPKVKKSTKEK